MDDGAAADAASTARRAEVFWVPLITQLTEMDKARALGGICAIITERLAMVRSGGTDGWVYLRAGEIADKVMADQESDPRAVARLAAGLAAEIDRMGTP